MTASMGTAADFLGELLANHTLRTVGMGAVFLGIANGVLGSFAVLRKQSLLGDAISHAALPGIALAFLLVRTKSTAALLLGAVAAGWLGTLFIASIVKNTRIKYDSALGLVLSVFFGFGLILLTYIQRMPIAAQAGLDTFLFGQAATLLVRDVAVIGGLGAAVLLVVMAFWKEFKLLCFDPGYANSLGYPVQLLDVLLTTLLVVSIVTGLQTVGVVLMSAMVVAPAAAARQWTDKLGAMVAISAFFGALAGAGGALASSIAVRLPTGPTIVLCLSAIVAVSLLLAPNRGLVWRWARERVNRHRIRIEAVLADLYVLASRHEDPGHGHPISVLRTMSIGHGGVDRSLELLRERGHVRKNEDGTWSLTPGGFEEARRLAGKREEEP